MSGSPPVKPTASAAVLLPRLVSVDARPPMPGRLSAPTAPPQHPAASFSPAAAPAHTSSRYLLASHRFWCRWARCTHGIIPQRVICGVVRPACRASCATIGARLRHLCPILLLLLRVAVAFATPRGLAWASAPSFVTLAMVGPPTCPLTPRDAKLCVAAVTSPGCSLLDAAAGR
jgi:hypothetical protein